MVIYLQELVKDSFIYLVNSLLKKIIPLKKKTMHTKRMYLFISNVKVFFLKYDIIFKYICENGIVSISYSVYKTGLDFKFYCWVLSLLRFLPSFLLLVLEPGSLLCPRKQFLFFNCDLLLCLSYVQISHLLGHKLATAGTQNIAKTVKLKEEIEVA